MGKSMVDLQTGGDEVTSVKDTDLFLLTRSPSGVADDKVVSTKNLMTGWVEVTDTWTYASASTITIPSDGTTKYQKAMKIRLKQGGSYKYFVAASVAATLITVIVSTDYTVANSAITDIAYSFDVKPFGFPTSFAYTPSWISDGTQPVLNNGTLTGSWSVLGGLLKVSVELHTGSGSTYGTSTYRISVPVTSAAMYMGSSLVLDISPVTYYSGISQIGSGTSSMIFIVGSTTVGATAPITFASGDYIWGDVLYAF